MILRSMLVSAALLSAMPAFAVEPATSDAGAGAPTSAAQPPAAAAPAAPKERIICKKEMDIGSWVRGTRRCATVSEWRKASQSARDTTANIQAQKGAFNQ